MTGPKLSRADGARDDQVVHIDLAEVAQEAVQKDIFVPDLDYVSRQADQALDEILERSSG